MKRMFKKAIIKRVMKKRKASQNFDEVKSELHQLPIDADETINNSYYYASHDLEGNAFIMRLGQRGGEQPISEIWFGFVSKEGRAYMNSQLIYPLDESPVKTECIEPLRRWTFSFKGKVVPVEAGEDKIAIKCGEEIEAEFEGEFTSDYGLFEFSRDTHINAYSTAIAAQKWHKGFSEELKKNHQTRIEQAGHAKCTLKVDDKEYSMDAPALRDQAYGRRIWSYMDHYSWLVGNLEDGRAFNTVLVLYPTINVVGLKTGYITCGKEYVNLLDVDYPKHFITAGKAPLKGNAQAAFSDKSKAEIEFETKIIFPYQFNDNEGGFNVYEGITTYTFNGLKGAGIAEFSYNTDKKRYENF
ncbi:MAG: hypothetical protein FWE03_05200 [Firmicutes bacterium]|nr:hypothetical protein [Bacillota bacterium]